MWVNVETLRCLCIFKSSGFQKFISGIDTHVYVILSKDLIHIGMMCTLIFLPFFFVSLITMLYKVFLGICLDSIIQIYFKLGSSFMHVFFCPFLVSHISKMYLLNISLIYQCQTHFLLSNHVSKVVNSAKNFCLWYCFDLYWLHFWSGIFYTFSNTFSFQFLIIKLHCWF